MELLTCSLRCEGGVSLVTDVNTQVIGREERDPDLSCPGWHIPGAWLLLPSLVAPNFRFITWLGDEPRWRVNSQAWRSAKEGDRATHRTDRGQHQGALGSQPLTSSGLIGV